MGAYSRGGLFCKVAFGGGGLFEGGGLIQTRELIRGITACLGARWPGGQIKTIGFKSDKAIRLVFCFYLVANFRPPKKMHQEKYTH